MRQRQKVHIGYAAIDRISFRDAVQTIASLATERRAAFIVTPNADHIVRLEHDQEFQKIYAAADLVVADGMPLVWGSHLLKQPIPERITGSDLMPALCQEASEKALSVFLLGGMPGEAEQAISQLRTQFPQLLVAGFYCPPFGFERDAAECARIVDMINRTEPHFVFVGVGSPKQETWIAKHRAELRCGVLLGIGISIAFLAGTVQRAPAWMQRVGLEWLYRWTQEPGRLTSRYLRDFSILTIIWREWRRQNRARK